MKKILIWTGSVIGAAAVLALVLTCLDRMNEQRLISVSGECLTTAPKDRTAITLRVTTLNVSASVSMKEATDKIAEITSFLKTQDVEMQTTQFNSYEKTEWDRDSQKSIVLGIETSIAIEVSAKNTETIEKVLAQFAGQANIYSENLRMFTSTETMQPILEKCLGIAVENARARANAIAAGDGKTVGRLIAAEYGSAPNASVRPTANFLRSAKVETMAMDMAAGGLVSKDTEVSVTVSAAFEVK